MIERRILPKRSSSLSEALQSAPPALSEEGLAQRFTEQHGDTMRYVAKWGCWYIWNGKRWRRDDTLRAFSSARKIAREAAAELDPKQRTEAKAIASAKTVAAIERLARADEKHAATVDQWDFGLDLLNTPGGTVDLREGCLTRHEPADYLTKLTAVTPDRSGCDLWLRFLDRITGGDQNLQRFLQRAAGYSLTGHTREDALLLCWGTGRNGKGTLLSTLAYVLGDYATNSATETFTVAKHDRHSTDLAKLRGARLVTAQETSQGQRWDEARIKMLTGGDTISARFMRQDNFDYVPQFKLWFATNNKPSLSRVDEAMRARIKLVPFTVFIPPEERDRDLRMKLRKEAPAILNWMIEGCLEWQEIGLKTPDRVNAATESYFAAEDKIGRWLEDCCEQGDGMSYASSWLFKSYCAWCERQNERPGTQKAFSEELLDRKFEKTRNMHGVIFRGLRCTEEDETLGKHEDRFGH